MVPDNAPPDDDTTSTDDIAPDDTASTDDIAPGDTASTDDIAPGDTASTDDIAPDNTSPSDANGTASNDFLAPGDDAPADLVDVLVYGLVGGIAGTVLSVVPFATVLGGAVAGYLCGGRTADALKTGTVAGIVMTLPFVAMVFFLLFLLGFAGAPAEFGVIALGVIGLAAVYTLGSGIVGGILGNALRGRL